MLVMILTIWDRAAFQAPSLFILIIMSPIAAAATSCVDIDSRSHCDIRLVSTIKKELLTQLVREGYRGKLLRNLAIYVFRLCFHFV
jgi:hypothetical protein